MGHLSEDRVGDVAVEERAHGHRGRRRPKWLGARVRRLALATVIGVLAALQGVQIRKQFPGEERQKNRAYDAGLRALDGEPRDFVRAEMEFRRYLDIEPRHKRVRYLLAVALQHQGKRDETRREYLRVLEIDPQMDEARVALAELALGEQDYAEALRHLRIATAEEPTPSPAYVLTGRCLVEIGDHDGAATALRQAVQRDPDNHDSRLELADLLMARSLLAGSVEDRAAAAAMYREAEATCRTRLTAKDDKRLRLSLAKAISGQARVLQSRELAEAVKELRHVQEMDPDDPEPVLLLGRFFQNAGDLVEARRTLEDAARKWRTRDVLLALHELYAMIPDARAEALKTLQDAVAENVGDAALRVRLVGFLTATGRLDDAEREADAAQQLFVDDPQVHAARGDLARERARRAEREGDAAESAKRHAQALAAYRRALERSPRSLRLKKLVAAELLGASFTREPGAEPSEDEKFARRCIEDVLHVNARDTEALGWQARLLVADGDFAGAVERLRPLVDAPAPPLEALRILGLACARTGDVALASDVFHRVVDIQAPRRGDRRAEPRAAPAADWENAIRASLDAGKLDAGIRLAMEAAKAWPEAPALRRLLATGQLRRRDVQGALAVLRDARRDFPEDADTRVLLARAYEAAGQLDAAEEELRTGITDIQGDVLRLAYFDFLARSGRAEAAEQGFLSLVAAAPTNAAGHLRLGDFYMTLRPAREDAALRSYEQALELAGGGTDALVRIAELHLVRASRDAAGLVDAEAVIERFAAAAPSDPTVMYLRGKLLLAGGRGPEAVPLLEQFAAARPESAPGLYYLGRALRTLERYDEAVEPLERAVRLAPQNEEMRLELAIVLHELGLGAFQRGDYDAARELLARAEEGGARRGSRLLLAGAHANARQFDLSEKECRRLVADEPDNQAALHLLAGLLLQKPDAAALDEAETIYRRLLEIDPGDVLGRVGIGGVLFQKGLWREALDTFREVYPRTDADPGVALVIAECMATLGDAAEAFDFLDAEARTHPKVGAFRHIKGDFLVAVQQHADAVAEFLAAYRLDPKNTGALLAAAAAHVDARQYEEARKLLEDKLPQAQHPALVRVALGDVLFHLGRIEESGAEIRKALADDPGHAHALTLLGKIEEHAGNLVEARRHYREAIQRGAPTAEPYARLAQLVSHAGERSEAAELYTTALRYEPRNHAYLNNLAEIRGAEEGRLEEAVSIARTANALAPDVAEIADTYGWLLFRAGRAAEAADLLLRAARRLEKDPVVQYHAGMALSRAQRPEEARARLAKALGLSKDFAGAEAARSELERLGQ